MPRDRAENELFPSRDRPPAALRASASEELANRIWGADPAVPPEARAPAPPPPSEPRVAATRKQGTPEATRSHRLRIADGSEGDRGRSSAASVYNGRGRAEAILAAQAREIRELRGAIGALARTVVDVRDALRKERSRSKQVTPARRGSGQSDETKAMSSLQTEVAALAKRIDELGRPRAAPRLSKEVDALDQRLEALEKAVRTTIPRAMTRAVDRRLERRLADLLEQIEVQLQDAVAVPPSRPETQAAASTKNDHRRRRLFRKSRGQNPEAGAGGEGFEPPSGSRR